MSEFNNRIDAQRRILCVVNSHCWRTEALSGLSNRAIDRWLLANQINPNAPIACLIRASGHALFFLANKSQEQITDEYKHRSQEVNDLTEAIADELATLSSGHAFIV
ncbi:hypothetical protein [Stenotrophomonas sp. GZD-301]|uniref:hypothetical protein n=1 Tax=Stenotrophomonas sp. GZD-301 TaxID=3404814 RepID=UPI003BB68DFF